MACPHRGEIWLADLRPTRGRERGGRRPPFSSQLIFFNAGPADLVVVLPLTSPQRDIPLHVKVSKGDGGTRNDGAAVCEAIRSVSKDRLISRWGMLSHEAMAEVEDRLRILLDL
ncbi:MAG: growth inhibitor PemK [Verrucomicrobia bacterium]|nr:MAG: growth inhibitor PemK [Verrucomicrobiota bacterium]